MRTKQAREAVVSTPTVGGLDSARRVISPVNPIL